MLLGALLADSNIGDAALREAAGCTLGAELLAIQLATADTMAMLLKGSAFHPAVFYTSINPPIASDIQTEELDDNFNKDKDRF